MRSRQSSPCLVWFLLLLPFCLSASSFDRVPRHAATVAAVNRAAINSWNQLGAGLELYAENPRFANFSREEFAAKFLGLKRPRGGVPVSDTPQSRHKFVAPRTVLPSAVDWRNSPNSLTLMGPVRDQGDCGSCWAFATITCIEAVAASEFGQFTAYSEQEIVDCADSYGAEGCDGGWFTQAFDYVKDHGLARADTYPYVARDQPCAGRGQQGRLTGLRSYSAIRSHDETTLMARVAQAPVAVAVDATKFQFYDSGIMTPYGCSSSDNAVNHAVTIIGYDRTGSAPYWIVRNSWGADWGEGGYLRMQMDHNTCGISDYPYAVNTV